VALVIIPLSNCCAVVTSCATTNACIGWFNAPAIWLKALSPTILNCGACDSLTPDGLLALGEVALLKLG